MTNIRTKTKDPKSTDFSKNEIVININSGTLFYKTNLGVHKISPTSTITPTSGLDGVDGLPGDHGVSAVSLSISSNSNIFTFDNSNDTDPTPTSVTITAIQNNQSTDLLVGVLTCTTNNATISGFNYTKTGESGVATWTVTPALDGETGFGVFPITLSITNDGITKTLILHKVSGGEVGEAGETTTIDNSYFDDIGGNTAATLTSTDIAFDGKIGIGDFGVVDSFTAPTDKLQVQDGNIRLGKTTTQGILTADSDLVMAVNDGSAGFMIDHAMIKLTGNDPLNPNPEAVVSIHGDLRVINNASSAGIGEGSLDVGGNINANTTGKVASFYDIELNSQILIPWAVGGANLNTGLTGDVISYTSDRRLKKNINPMENSLSKILSLRGVTYEWKDKNKEGIHSGFIAQELEEIIPEAVGTNKTGKIIFGPKTTKTYKTISPTTLIPFLVEAIKDQQIQIDELKEKLK